VVMWKLLTPPMPAPLAPGSTAKGPTDCQCE
jgi:hypothetical protein